MKTAIKTAIKTATNMFRGLRNLITQPVKERSIWNLGLLMLPPPPPKQLGSHTRLSGNWSLSGDSPIYGHYHIAPLYKYSRPCSGTALFWLSSFRATNLQRLAEAT